MQQQRKAHDAQPPQVLASAGSLVPCCWICHDDILDVDTTLCNCSPHRLAHRECLWRWRFVKAGTAEEHQCRFCSTCYPPLAEAWPHLPRSSNPVMTLTVHGVKHAVPVTPGPVGMEAFQRDVRRLFGLRVDEHVEISFSCVTPGSHIKVVLSGWGAYDAALMAASIACAAGTSDAPPTPPAEPVSPVPGLLQRVVRWLPGA